MTFVENSSKLKALRSGTGYPFLRLFIDILLVFSLIGLIIIGVSAKNIAPIGEPLLVGILLASGLSEILVRCLLHAFLGSC